ncbi:MAG: autotransporter domain-containing protein [Planctomycetota bacterium]
MTGGAAGDVGGNAGSALGTGIFLNNTNVLVEVTGSNTLTISDVIADNSFTNGGDGPVSELEKAGTGTLVLTATNLYSNTAVTEGFIAISADTNLGTGDVTLNGGGLQVDDGFSSSRAYTLGGDGGTLNVTSGTATFSGVISGPTGSLTKTGDSVLILSGTNTHGGGTIITEGTVAITDDANLGITNGDLTFNGGTLRFDAATTVARDVNLTASQGFVDTNGNDATLSGVISGTGGLTKNGDGVLTLSGFNSYQGGTTINQGTLAVTDDANLGNVAGGVAINGGTLQTNGVLSGRILVLGSAGATVEAVGTPTIWSGAVEGTGDFDKTGSGALILSGNNTYTGVTNVLDGILSFNGSNVFTTLNVDPSGTAVVASTGSLSNDVNVNIFGGGVSFDNAAQTIRALSGTGGIAVLNGQLTIAGGTQELYEGEFSGAGELILTNGSVLETTGITSAFIGTTRITNHSTLAVFGQHSGNIIVSSGGLLTGGNDLVPATVVSNVLIEADGFISPSIQSPAPSAMGELNIQGNYEQQGTYLVDLNDQGESDHLEITGTAILGGTLQLRAAPGTYLEGQRYNVLTAGGGIIGEFASILEDFPLLDVAAIYELNDVFLELVRNQVNFADVAATFNQLEVANTLDQYQSMSSGSNPQFDVLIEALSLGNTADIRYGLQQLDAEVFGSLATIQIESTDLYLRSITAHLTQLGGVGIGNTPTAFSLNNGSPMSMPQTSDRELQLVSFSDPDADSRAPSPAYYCRQDAPTTNAWVQGIGAGGGIGNNGNAVGLGYGIGATSFGVDRRFDNTILGVGGGYGYTSVAQSSGLGNATVDALHFSLYGMQRWEYAYLLGLTGYTFNQYDTERSINIGPVIGPATANYDGHEFLSYIESGLSIPVAGVTLQPFSGLRYLLLGQDGFAETGAGAANLTVGGQSFDSLRYSLGSRLIRRFETQVGNITPYVQGRWTHEVLENERLIDAQFTGVVGGSFVSQGNVLGRDFAEFGTGVTADLTSQVQVFLGYDAQISTRQSAHGGIGGLQIRW